MTDYTRKPKNVPSFDEVMQREDPREYWYRFNDPYEVATEPYLAEYLVLKRTPCGAWIASNPWDQVRFVKFGSGRRYAYPDKADALDSYIQRKTRQIIHGEATANRARRNLEAARAFQRGEKIPNAFNAIYFEPCYD